jgi:hypothetical protein
LQLPGLGFDHPRLRLWCRLRAFEFACHYLLILGKLVRLLLRLINRGGKLILSLLVQYRLSVA